MEITGEQNGNGKRILRNIRELSHEERFEKARLLRAQEAELRAHGNRVGDIVLQIAILEDIDGVPFLLHYDG